MPLAKPYPPIEIDYQDWNDLVDNYVGKAITKIVDKNGKGDYTTIQEAVDACPRPRRRTYGGGPLSGREGRV